MTSAKKQTPRVPELEDMRLSTTQACQLMGVCRQTLYRWELRGLIRPVRLPDGARRYSLRELQELSQPRRA